jgi:hypothetical protein
MSEYQKGLLITFFGVLFVTPDSLFVRLISSDGIDHCFLAKLFGWYPNFGRLSRLSRV